MFLLKKNLIGSEILKQCSAEIHGSTLWLQLLFSYHCLKTRLILKPLFSKFSIARNVMGKGRIDRISGIEQNFVPSAFFVIFASLKFAFLRVERVIFYPAES